VGKKYVFKAIKDIEELAKKEGLDFFPAIFEIVDRAIMLEGCSYGLPVRARHWSYGKSYQHQKLYGEMGLSKVYEIVFNNNPSYAFLLDTNPDIINIMVGAHVFGHIHFFKNNVMFEDSDRSMIYRAAERATRVDEYIEKYGLERVEHIMDIAFALDNHIDWHKGMFRSKYPKKRIVSVVKKSGEFDDLLNIGNNRGRSVIKKTVGDKLPPHPEKDLLWFLANYAPLEDWERDILTIAREESYYFYPIVKTKILNEGFACVLPDTLVFSNDGIVRMDDVVEKRVPVFDGDNIKNVIYSGIFRQEDSIKIRTKRGFVLGGANKHRILNASGEWIRLDELNVDDNIKISGGNNSWGKYQEILYKLPPKAKSASTLCEENGISYSTYYRNINGMRQTLEENSGKIQRIKDEINRQDVDTYTSSRGNRQSITIPNILDEKLASFLGYMIGDGHISKAARQVGITTGDEAMSDDIVYLFKKLFGLSCKRRFDDSSKNGRWRNNVYSKHLIDFLTNYIGLCFGVSASKKEIPGLILKSPKTVVSSFLRAYFDSDGCAHTNGITLSTSSDSLSEQVQVVLLNYGILSSRNKAKDGCWQLRIAGKSAKLFHDEIGFGLKRKQDILSSYIDNHVFFKKEVFEDKIVSIENIGKQDVYDITVEDTHKYAAAGFINHNSFWHAELMYKYDKLSEQEYMDFAKTHSGVVNPGNPFNINPYYLGFKILTDVRERWDEKYKNGESDIDGIKKILEVAAEEDDASFLRNYLTKELAVDLGLFNYGYRLEREPDMKEDELTEEHGLIELKDRDLDKIIENIIRPTINYGAPLITIDEVDGDTLVLSHRDSFGPLDEKYAEKTMEYIYELWGGPIELKTYSHKKEKVTYAFDEGGFDYM
jgi:stage V sporulation protein R